MKKLLTRFKNVFKEYGTARILCYTVLFIAYFVSFASLLTIVGCSNRIVYKDPESLRVIGMVSVYVGIVLVLIAASLIFLFKVFGWKDTFTKINFIFLVSLGSFVALLDLVYLLWATINH